MALTQFLVSGEPSTLTHVLTKTTCLGAISRRGKLCCTDKQTPSLKSTTMTAHTTGSTVGVLGSSFHARRNGGSEGSDSSRSSGREVGGSWFEAKSCRF